MVWGLYSWGGERNRVREGTVARYIVIQNMLTEVRLAAFHRIDKA